MEAKASSINEKYDIHEPSSCIAYLYIVLSNTPEIQFFTEHVYMLYIMAAACKYRRGSNIFIANNVLNMLIQLSQMFTFVSN